MSSHLVQVGYFLGLAICCLVLLQLMVGVRQMVLRYWRERKIQAARLEAICLEIADLRRQHFSGTNTAGTWEGSRKLRVDKKVAETPDCHSIYLVPHDGQPLPSFKPGQFLTFSLRLDEGRRPAVRCYSLSDGPGQPYYRCTIKKIPPPSDKPEFPAGKVSSYFNERVHEGDILDVRAPRGTFLLDTDSQDPLVLLAGGIGITPLLSMASSIVRTQPNRTVHLFYGVRNSANHPFKKDLEQLATDHENLRLHVFYSDPLPNDVAGQDFKSVGRMRLDHLRKFLPSNNFRFYLCGPPSFMESLTEALDDWGVPSDMVHAESFGPSTLKKMAKPSSEELAGPDCQITFDRSGKTFDWDPSYDSLLEFALSQGILLDSGCCAGNCGTCVTAVKSGDVSFIDEPGIAVEQGACLPCISVPKESLVLDA